MSKLFSLVDDPIRLLKLAADTKALKVGKQIHAHFVVTSDVSSKITPLVKTNSLINLYSKCGLVSIAHQLFDLMPLRNVVSWSALMAGYLHNGCESEVLGLFKSMVLSGDVGPNEFVLTTVVSSCSDSGRVKEGKQCHGFALKSGLVTHQHMKNSLVHMYSRCWCLEEALRVFNSVPGFDIFSYNSVLNGLLENGNPNEALEVLRTTVSYNVAWDSVTYVTSFVLCSSLKSSIMGRQVHCQLVKSRVGTDAFIESSIMDMYGKCGEVTNAVRIFQRLRVRGVTTWTTIMAAYFHNGLFEEALNMFSKMRSEGIGPNEYTFAVLLNSTASLSSLRHGDVLHACAEKSGLGDQTIVRNALINMYVKSGDIESANESFSFAKFRDTVTWNVMISGYSHHGLGNEALGLFLEMLSSGESPNHVTFVAVLSACAHLGSVKRAFYYLTRVMRRFRVNPGLEHHTCMVGLLGRAGRVEEAESYMRTTARVDWDIVAYRTLLNACCLHRKFRLGRQIGEVLMKKYPNDIGTYMILSNMYARAREWDRVARIRKLMRERSIKKEPGVSWVEIRNGTHVFVSGDESHPESGEIRNRARELLAAIRPLGYMPDVASALHDLADEQREDCVGFHSEKLAIAYALMKTPPGAPIRVIKNLRMCDDCHAATKFISKLVNRMIIVRDINRFHHFQDGRCSCLDYW